MELSQPATYFTPPRPILLLSQLPHARRCASYRPATSCRAVPFPNITYVEVNGQRWTRFNTHTEGVTIHGLDVVANSATSYNVTIVAPNTGGCRGWARK